MAVTSLFTDKAGNTPFLVRYIKKRGFKIRESTQEAERAKGGCSNKSKILN